MKPNLILQFILLIVSVSKAVMLVLFITTSCATAADWTIDDLPLPKSPAEATVLAKQLRHASIPLIKHDRRYEDQ